MPVRVFRVLGVAALLATVPAVVAAQEKKDNHWGASVSFTPTWTSHDELKKAFVEEPGKLEGSEFTVGLVRGSTRGGEWGVSFVKKPIKDARFFETQTDCFNAQSCSTFSFSRDFHKVYLQGAEFHWFLAFAHITNHAQIGLSIAVGVAQPKGTVTETRDQVNTFTNFQGQPITQTSHEQTEVPAKDSLGLPIYPLFKLEAQGAMIVTPAFKVKISGGFNLPGPCFRIGAIYLIGAK
jgi:hypothetical protein